MAMSIPLNLWDMLTLSLLYNTFYSARPVRRVGQLNLDMNMLFELEPSVNPNKTKSKREVSAEKRKTKRLAKATQALVDAIPSIEKGESIHYVSMGEWSTHDLIAHLLKFTGPAHLYACTWSITEHPIRQLVRMGSAGELISINMLMDWRTKVRCPEALQLARANFAEIKVANCHAKVSVLQNDDWKISIVGSANYTNNPRIEAGVIVDDEQIAAFHKEWISAEMAGANPFENER